MTLLLNSNFSDKRAYASPNLDHVVIGEVVGVWGIRGGLKVIPSTDLSERFSPGNTLYINHDRAVVLRSHRARSGLRVQLDIVKDRIQADAMKGTLLTIPANELKPLPNGSYYHYELIGLDVWTDDAEFLGTVREVLITGSNDVYVVRDEDRREILIPSIEDIVIEIILLEGKMKVRLPDGLQR